MVGGSDEDVAKVQPVFDALQSRGRARLRARRQEVGAGHFAKMVHNGIEYAMMQAYAEGWELLEAVDQVDNVAEVFASWRGGTVIRSWLLDLLVAALEEDEHLAQLTGYAEDSGEGRWTVEAAIDNAVPMHVDRGVALRPVHLAAGRQPGDEGDRRDAQPVRRARGPQAGGGRRGGDGRRRLDTRPA